MKNKIGLRILGGLAILGIAYTGNIAYRLHNIAELKDEIRHSEVEESYVFKEIKSLNEAIKVAEDEKALNTRDNLYKIRYSKMDEIDFMTMDRNEMRIQVREELAKAFRVF